VDGKFKGTFKLSVSLEKMQSTATASVPALVDVVAQPMEPRQVQILLAFVSNDTLTISKLMLFEVLNIFLPCYQKTYYKHRFKIDNSRF